MSMNEVQACLARLYVDKPFRRLFEMNRIAVMSEYRLSDEERAALAGIDTRQLANFASSLENKRKKRMRNFFPLLLALDPATIDFYFSRFHQVCHLRPGEPIHDDALAFGRFMAETLIDAPGMPSYSSDLALYEYHCIAARFGHRPETAAYRPQESAVANLDSSGSRLTVQKGVRMVQFAYDVIAIGEILTKDGQSAPTAVEPSPCSLVFRPMPANSESGPLRLNGATRTLLALCDGQRTVAQIVAAGQIAFGAEGIGPSIVSALERLVSLSVLGTEAGGRHTDPERGCHAA